MQLFLVTQAILILLLLNNFLDDNFHMIQRLINQVLDILLEKERKMADF